MALINISLSCFPLNLTAFLFWSITQLDSCSLSSDSSLPKSPSSLSLSSSELISTSSSPSILPKLERIARARRHLLTAFPRKFLCSSHPNIRDFFWGPLYKNFPQLPKSFLECRQTVLWSFSSAFLAHGFLAFFLSAFIVVNIYPIWKKTGMNFIDKKWNFNSSLPYHYCNNFLPQYFDWCI